MSKTRIQLVNRAAQKLMLVASGQSLESEDQELIEGARLAVTADLSARSIVDVQDNDEIDDGVFEWLADCLAQMIAPDFGKQRDMAVKEYAEKMLRTAVSANPTFEPLQATYF